MNLHYYLNYWALQTAAMLLTVILVPKLRLTGIKGAVLTVFAISVVNSFLWDAALFFAVPDSLTLHAVLLFLTNGIIFWVLVKLLPGIEVDGVLPALVAPVVFTGCSFVVSNYAGEINWEHVFAVSSDNLVALFRWLKDYFHTH